MWGWASADSAEFLADGQGRAGAGEVSHRRQFERDPAVAAEVAGQVDGGVAAPAEHRFETVAGDDVAPGGFEDGRVVHSFSSASSKAVADSKRRAGSLAIIMSSTGWKAWCRGGSVGTGPFTCILSSSRAVSA